MRRHNRNPWLESRIDWTSMVLLALLGLALGVVAVMVVR